MVKFFKRFYLRFEIYSFCVMFIIISFEFFWVNFIFFWDFVFLVIKRRGWVRGVSGFFSFDIFL